MGRWPDDLGGNSYLRLWRADPGGQGVKTIAFDGADVESLAFSPDGKIAAVGSMAVNVSNDTIDGVVFRDKVRLVDGASLKQRAILDIEGGAESIAFSPDGKSFATAGYSEKIRLWSIKVR